MGENTIRIELVNIKKSFPGLIANDNVNLKVKRGEIRCILGENGAGKSTLMNILYGLLRPDRGKILIDGKEVQFSSPKDAIACGIGMVHQHFMLIPTFSVIENLLLGHLGFELIPDKKECRARVKELSAKYNLQVNPNAKIWQLTVGEQQRVEILKILYYGASILILDEPTSVLTPNEVDHLFVILAQLKQKGYAIIFITHKLWEAREISDNITIMRGGKVIDTLPTKKVDNKLLARLMVGRERLFHLDKQLQTKGEVILTVNKLEALNDKGWPALRDVNLKVHGHEILGVVGVAGNGQKELAEAIFGLRKVTGGRILLTGQDITNKAPKTIQKKGVSYIPEDRINVGTGQELTVQENIIAKEYEKPPFCRRGLILCFTRILVYVVSIINKFNIATRNPATPVKNLSGGNIQKVILGRELSRKSSLVLAEQPTSGLDIGATEFVHSQLIAARDNGAGVLLISSNLDELFRISDRLVVIFEGQIVGDVHIKEAQKNLIGEWMLGLAAQTTNSS